MDAAAYARQLKQLLPPGSVWPTEPTSVVGMLMRAMAEELARIDQRGQDLQNEWDPSTASETLDDWERIFGLPDGCLAAIPDSTSERRLAVFQKYANRGGQSRAFYIALAATLGYAVTIAEYQVCRAGFHAGDLCNGNDWAYTWRIDIDASGGVPGLSSITVFRAGSRAGQRLVGFGEIDIECIFRRVKPAHTYVLFTYV